MRHAGLMARLRVLAEGVMFGDASECRGVTHPQEVGPLSCGFGEERRARITVRDLALHVTRKGRAICAAF